jgi:hypothetical protein
MARGPVGIRFAVDFTSVIDSLGAGLAIGEISKDQSYLDAIVDAAWGEAEHQFNIEAASYAATGHIKHMYEWGTAGINRGRSNMRPNPLSERARLWQTTNNGHGLNRVLAYHFKPSLAYVPKPTKRDTGMDPAIIEQLQWHVFTWKASVLETGAEVTIMPKGENNLLIPYYPEADPGLFSPYDRRRGYTISKGPHTHSPGETGGTVGTFQTYWTAFWEGRGNKMMDESLEKQIEMDFYPQLNSRRNGGITPVKPGAVSAGVQKAKKKAQTTARAKAKGRKKTND